MSIQRKVKVQEPKRQQSELIEKHKKIGELLQLERVPVHRLAWKEPRLELETADCYPVVDVLERIAELLPEIANLHLAKKPGRPRKVK